MANEINEKLIADMVRKILQGQESAPVKNTATFSKSPASSALKREDYPLGTNRTDLLVGPRGKRFDELTLEKIEKGEVSFDDFKITSEALEYQAQIAEAAGSPQIARNLRRAAELAKVPDERVLEIYNALRPHRSTKKEIMAIAEELDATYGATISASFVREAADVYERRKLLRGDLPTE